MGLGNLTLYESTVKSKNNGKTLGLPKSKSNGKGKAKAQPKKKVDQTSAPPQGEKAKRNAQIKELSTKVLTGSGTPSEKLAAIVGVESLKVLDKIERNTSALQVSLIKQTKVNAASNIPQAGNGKPNGYELLKKAAFDEARDFLRDQVYVYLEKPTSEEQKDALTAALPAELIPFKVEIWNDYKSEFPKRISSWESKIKKDIVANIGPFFQRYQMDQQYLNILDMPAGNAEWDEIFQILEHLNKGNDISVDLPEQPYEISIRKRFFFKELWAKFKKNDKVQQKYQGALGPKLLVTVDGEHTYVEPVDNIRSNVDPAPRLILDDSESDGTEPNEDPDGTEPNEDPEVEEPSEQDPEFIEEPSEQDSEVVEEPEVPLQRRSTRGKRSFGEISKPVPCSRKKRKIGKK